METNLDGTLTTADITSVLDPAIAALDAHLQNAMRHMRGSVIQNIWAHANTVDDVPGVVARILDVSLPEGSGRRFGVVLSSRTGGEITFADTRGMSFGETYDWALGQCRKSLSEIIENNPEKFTSSLDGDAQRWGDDTVGSFQINLLDDHQPRGRWFVAHFRPNDFFDHVGNPDDKNDD